MTTSEKSIVVAESGSLLQAHPNGTVGQPLATNREEEGSENETEAEKLVPTHRENPTVPGAEHGATSSAKARDSFGRSHSAQSLSQGEQGRSAQKLPRPPSVGRLMRFCGARSDK